MYANRLSGTFVEGFVDERVTTIAMLKKEIQQLYKHGAHHEAFSRTEELVEHLEQLELSYVTRYEQTHGGDLTETVRQGLMIVRDHPEQIVLPQQV